MATENDAAPSEGTPPPKPVKNRFAPTPPSIKDHALELLGLGTPIKEIAKQTGVSEPTIQKWKKQLLDKPKGTNPPPIVDRSPQTGKGKRGAGRAITEETAGQICAALFAMVALADSPVWFLTDAQRKALGEPLADSMTVLPAPVADAINKYTSPAVFAASLGAIVSHKMRLRAQGVTESGRPIAQVQATTRGPVVPPGPTIVPPPPVNEPGPQGSSEIPADVAAALDAARSSTFDVEGGDLSTEVELLS